MYLQGSQCARDGSGPPSDFTDLCPDRATRALQLLQKAMMMPQWQASAGAESRQPADTLSAAVDHMLKNATWDRVAALAERNSRGKLQGALCAREPVCLDESVLLAPAGDSNPNAAGKRCQALGSPSRDGQAAEKKHVDTMKESLSMVHLNSLYQQVLEGEGKDMQTAVRSVLQSAVSHISAPALQGLARAVEVAVGTPVPNPVNRVQKHSRMSSRYNL